MIDMINLIALLNLIDTLNKEKRCRSLCTAYYINRIKTPYLCPLSYGIPSAFGAREWLEVRARTISEMM